jgi:peroxiredoxin
MLSVYQKEKLLQMANVKETDLPDLLLPDQRGKMISLSSLNGKTVLLNFWSVNQLESIEYVVKLKKIYEKYHKMGFEIYQVSVDKTIPRWEKALEFEELAWINVIDTAFPASATYTLFNIKELPMNYLINAEQSDIIAKNISPAALDRTLSNLFNK